MCSDENIFDFLYRSSLIYFRISSSILKSWSYFFVTPSDQWLINQSWFCVVFRYIFLSDIEVLLLVVYLFDTIVLEKYSVFWIRYQSRVFVVCQSIFCVVCRDIFLSTVAVFILILYFFDLIFLETLSVRWLRNQSIVFFRSLIIWKICGFMFCIELIKNELEYVRVECKHFEYIALKLIEYQSLFECWAG